MYSDIYSLPFFLRISNVYLFIVYGKVKRPARYDCALRVNKPEKSCREISLQPTNHAIYSLQRTCKTSLCSLPCKVVRGNAVKVCRRNNGAAFDPLVSRIHLGNGFRGELMSAVRIDIACGIRVRL